MKARQLLGVAVLAGATALSGCATSGGDSGSETPTASTSGSPTQKVTLRFQSLAFQEPTVEASKKIVQAWNTANPNVQVEYVQGSWDSVHDQLVTQFQGGTAPDIIQNESADMVGFAKQGYLADLKPHLSEEIVKDIPEGVWKTVTVDGKVIAAPTLLQSYVVFANTKLLQAAGVTVPTGDTMTWDQFASMAKAATKGKQYGLGWGLKQPTSTVLSLDLNFGGTFFETADGKTSIKVGENELAVPKRIHDMAYKDKSLDPATLSQGGGDVLTAFVGGKYAMTVGGNYAAQQMTETAPAGFTWAVLPLLEGTSANQVANPQTMSVAAGSKNVKEAAAFINFFMKAENLGSLAEGDWLIPTSAGARAAVQKSTGGKNGWEQTLAGGDKLVEAPFQSVEFYPQWKDQIATPALQQFFANKIDANQLSKRLTDGWNQVNRG